MGSQRRRVVVTGLGMVSPIGNSVEDSWQALLAGLAGAAPISRFDCGRLPSPSNGAVSYAPRRSSPVCADQGF